MGMICCLCSAVLSAAVHVEPGVLLRRTVPVPWGTATWSDVTEAVQAALPRLDCAVVHLEAPSSEVGVALLDPRVMSLGDAAAAAPSGAAEQRSVALAVCEGALLLPSHARIVALRVAADCGAEPLEMCVEVASSLATRPPRLPPRAALARATLLACLAEAGAAPAELHSLEGVPTGGASAAQKTFAGFVTRNAGGDEDGGGPLLDRTRLLADARRTAHHICHLVRLERVQAAAFVRNTDMPSSTRLPAHPIHLVLDNVRSAYNVGSIFRTADTARLAEVITCGFTPHPPHPKLLKTGFDAISQVPHRHFESTRAAISALRSEGVPLLAMETTERSLNYASFPFPRKGVALVLGNEETGVDTDVLGAVDDLIEIPCLGYKNSLNIASAASIVVFEVLRQWGALTGEAGEGSDAVPASGAAVVAATGSLASRAIEPACVGNWEFAYFEPREFD